MHPPDTAQDTGKGHLFSDQGVGLIDLPLCDTSQVARYVDSCGAGLNTGGSSWDELLWAEGTQRTYDIKDGDAVGAYLLAPSTGSAGPRIGRGCNLLCQIKLHVSQHSSDIKAVHPGEGTRRAAEPALLAGTKHAYVIDDILS